MNGDGGGRLAERQEMMRLAQYEGWVAWIGDVPIFEAHAWRPDLIDLEPSAPAPDYRPKDRRHIDWDDLPHEKVTTLELYFARDHYERQPVVRIDRWPDSNIRWIQQKERAIQVHAEVASPSAPLRDSGVQRTRVQGYRIGYYNPHMLGTPGPVDFQTAPTLIYYVKRDGMKRRAFSCHPCWPKPHGLGMAPKVLGLDPRDVPAPPKGTGDEEDRRTDAALVGADGRPAR